MDTFIQILEVLGGISGSLFFFCFVLRFIGFRLDMLAAIAGTLFLTILALLGCIEIGIGPAMPLFMIVMLAVGWIVYAFFRYRQARQHELLQVITTAIEAQLPLAPAIRAYLRDRPHSGPGGVWDSLLLLLAPPGYLLWYQRHRFDQRIVRLSELLSDGVPLATALRYARGVAPRDVRVAATVGGLGGRLAECLRRAESERLAGAWLDVVPRLLYPALLLLFIFGVTTFFGQTILPRFGIIFRDFNEPLPVVTTSLISAFQQFDDFRWILTRNIQGLIFFFIVLIISPAVRWHTPLVGRLFRWEMQGLVLRMLGVLLDAGRTAPEALQLLAGAEDFPTEVKRRLTAARQAVERGELLAVALRRAGLLPSSMTPLLQTAERTRTLPWALTELGSLLAGRAAHVARRMSLTLSPVLVIAVGLLVGFIALAMFTPLVQILTRLSV